MGLTPQAKTFPPKQVTLSAIACLELVDSLLCTSPNPGGTAGKPRGRNNTRSPGKDMELVPSTELRAQILSGLNCGSFTPRKPTSVFECHLLRVRGQCLGYLIPTGVAEMQVKGVCRPMGRRKWGWQKKLQMHLTTCLWILHSQRNESSCLQQTQLSLWRRSLLLALNSRCPWI